MNKSEFADYLKKNFPRTSSFFSGFALFLVDILVLILCIALGFFIVNLFSIRNINFKSFINYTVFIPFILLLFAFMGLYPGIMIPAAEQVKKYTFSTFFGFSIITAFVIVSSHTQSNPAAFFKQDSGNVEIVWAFILAFIFSIFLLPAFREFSKRVFCKRSWWGVPAVIYCTGNSADEVIKKLNKNKFLGYKPAVIIDASLKAPEVINDIPAFPPENEVNEIIHDYNIKQAILCDYRGEISTIMTSYRYTIAVSKSQSSFTSSQQLKDIAGIIGFASTHNLTFKTNLLIKRLMDVGLIVFFSPILIPVFFILIILTKCTSRGPVFYGHKRVGKNGKEFKCWKFRSMCIDADKKLEEILANNPQMREEWEKERKFQNDPRVTKFGKFLRKTSLDELPQLINILVGQMSFVGPRPVTQPEIEKYGQYKDYVLSVSPGLSGMWQTSGRSDTEYEERISLDSYYIQNWSIWLDIWILIKTVWVVLKGRGAY
ncbi:MAG: undecaprenyl-phosphate galactose phosphotransferase WbaP [Treponema sp.]|nr:undecaprenyl-phosphate galactose phosphotransferase WbaP [Treponema sp.]